MLTFTVWGQPVPQGSKRAFVVRGKDGKARPVVAESAGGPLRQWRSDVIDAARQAMDGRGPIEGPVDITAIFYLRPPKQRPPRHPHRRPDLDKLLRALLDALTSASLLRDDAQVITLHAMKRYASEPRVEVSVREVVG